MYNERKVRAQTQCLHIISSTDNEYQVSGTTGNIYLVTLDKITTCTCPDYIKREKKCKHIYFVKMKLSLKRAEVAPNYIDDFCAICFEEFTEDNIDYCKKQCGRRVHKSCFQSYASRGISKCIFCRVDWI